MTVMSSYYAHESDVGPVFDVANYSPLKSIFTGLIALGFGTAIAVAAAYFWNPEWLITHPAKEWAKAHQETKDLMRQHPVAVKAGVAVAGMFALLCIVGSLSCVVNAFSSGFYIRAGQGGLSLNVPYGLMGRLHQDFGWEDIAQFKVVQEKQLGAMSRSAGNCGGEIQLRLHSGKSYLIRLDHFRQDAWLIHKRIQESTQMETPQLTAV